MAHFLGIDEAGRGAVIGPLVMCGVLISEENCEKLKKLGVKDSKELTPEKREKLFEDIKELAQDYLIVQISAKQLDEQMKRKNLNEIEIEKMSQIIESFWLKKPKIYIDAIECNTEKFRKKLLTKIQNKELELICENKADSKYVVVGAASIMAKVIRDNEIKKLHETHGNFGSGYPSDEGTIKFLEGLGEKVIKEVARLEWETTKRLLSSKKNKSLFEFN